MRGNENRLKEAIVVILKEHRRRKISLIELQEMISHRIAPQPSYEELYRAIHELLKEGTLSPIASSGYTTHKEALPRALRIHTDQLFRAFRMDLSNTRLTLHPKLSLDVYYHKSEATWYRDKPWILAIDAYLRRSGLPQDVGTVAERSFEITGNEKWLDELGGMQLIERLGIKDDLLLIREVEPMAFGLNRSVRTADQGHHLIVENKSIFFRLLDLLQGSRYETLIYGAGWRVVSGIDAFRRQYPSASGTHRFAYFGDLDREGIAIWHALSRVCDTSPAPTWYRSLLDCEAVPGKETHRRRPDAEQAFLAGLQVGKEEGERIISILGTDHYIPQEALAQSAIEALMGGQHV